MLRASIEHYIVVLLTTPLVVGGWTAAASSTASTYVAATTAWLVIMLFRMAYDLLKYLVIHFHSVFVDLHEPAEIRLH